MITKICDKIIKYSFYALFFLVPIVFTSATSELFELNKMWLTWVLTIIIGASWLIKMALQKKIIFQKTFLDIPIGLFLLSQVISTIFSMDFHVSLWGYYSRFNGGLLSIISYILLYYAFLSNFQNDIVTMVKKSLFVSLASGLIVALWGLPSHFGYDPTCLLFRGTFDVSCWTADFMPKVRIFSTMGQPDWLAAYLAILIPVSFAYFISNWKLPDGWRIGNWKLWTCLILTVLFFIDLLYTRARSGFIGIWLSIAIFVVLYFWLDKSRTSLREKLKSPLVILIAFFLITMFIVGTPIGQLRTFTLGGIRDHFQESKVAATTQPTPVPVQSFESGGGGTESGNIRLFVWTGALNAWKSNPIFGTGVETFAFAYYKYKPAGQNLTSEWNFLYNKAHNEFLNYLTTTGIVGLGTYLLMIGYFLTTTIRNLFQHLKNLKNETLKQAQDDNNKLLILALLVSYISILITNFFGFSVVITNIYLFMIPAFVFALMQQEKIKPAQNQMNRATEIYDTTSIWQWTPILFIIFISLFMIFQLSRFWEADKAYALGSGLNRTGEYQQAYSNLHKAVDLWGNEPVFKDEMSINNAIVATGLISQKPTDPNTKQQAINTASALAQEAINTSNEVIAQHSNNVVFWKTRTRLFYTLSQVDSRYLSRALDAIIKASLIAPNDANIWYNLGVLYGQNNNLQKGIEALEKTIRLKPNYRDAHYALGLFYRSEAMDKSGKIMVDENFNKKAIGQMEYILKNIDPKDADAQKSLSEWAR
jgi:putative inorganic carbon (hco3(-)) transporter